MNRLSFLKLAAGAAVTASISVSPAKGAQPTSTTTVKPLTWKPYRYGKGYSALHPMGDNTLVSVFRDGEKPIWWLIWRGPRMKQLRTDSPYNEVSSLEEGMALAERLWQEAVRRALV